MPDVTEVAPRPGGRFLPGVSGNPAGKPKGARNRPSEALDALLRRVGARHGKHLVKVLVAAARAGDANAAAVLLDAIQRAEAPPR